MTLMRKRMSLLVRLLAKRARWALRSVAVAVAAVAVVGAYALIVWLAPRLLGVPDLTAPATGDAVLTARHNARLLVVSGIGAVVVAVGLLYTARNYRLSYRGQVTDRYTKALERLGSSEMYVRIGGLHALRQVMIDSPEHHDDVVEVLVAFIRDRAPRRQNAPDSPIYPMAALPAEPEPMCRPR